MKRVELESENSKYFYFCIRDLIIPFICYKNIKIVKTLLIHCKGIVNFIFHFCNIIYIACQIMNNSVDNIERVNM